MASTPIRGLFYAEFDNIAGPRIVTQSPSGFISDEDFELIGEHTIVSANDVAGRVVTIAHPGFRPDGGPGKSGSPSPSTVVAFPVCLSHSKYPRNAFIYCVGVILPSGTPTGPYEPVLRKLGAYLYGMETESEFLSQRARKAGLEPLLASIRSGLNSRGECFVAVDSCDTIALKLFPSLPPPPTVRDHDVPVRVRDLDRLAGPGHAGWALLTDDGAGLHDSSWDLIFRLILPLIDGVSFVRAIAEAADVEASLVRSAVAQLAYYGLVVLVDVFSYSNVYATCPAGLQRLMREPALQTAVSLYAALDPDARNDSSTSGGTLPPASTITRLYMAFGAGSRICDVCAQGDTRGLGVDDRRLAVFGVIHGVLRRVHKYPVPAAAAAAALAPATQTGQTNSSALPVSDGRPGGSFRLGSRDLALLDGTRHCDELCCLWRVSLSSLEEAIASAPSSEVTQPGGARFTYVFR